MDLKQYGSRKLNSSPTCSQVEDIIDRIEVVAPHHLPVLVDVVLPRHSSAQSHLPEDLTELRNNRQPDHSHVPFEMARQLTTAC